MLRPYSNINRIAIYIILFLLRQGGPPVLTPAPLRAHAAASSFLQAPRTSRSAQAATATLDVSELFRQTCTKCHGADGTGSPARGWLPEIPDFTSAAWQARRVDARLMASILDGKGSLMPPQGGKINEEQARALVAHVRAFAAGGEKSMQGDTAGRAMASFHERYRRLQEEQEELRRQVHELSRSSSDEASSKLSESGQHTVARESALASLGKPSVGDLFTQRCEKCHGAEGTGNRMRGLMSEIPDFTNVSWQARRTDAQLTASVLDGKGSDMPLQRGKIGEEQVRSLVAYVRAFAPVRGNPGPVKKEGPALAQLPQTSFEKRQPSAPTETRVQTYSTTSFKRHVPPHSAQEVPVKPAVGDLFRSHCVKCHGVDGTGSRLRSRVQEIPDFTSASWQARRSNAELTESILNGKGSAMPPESDDLDEEQGAAWSPMSAPLCRP